MAIFNRNCFCRLIKPMGILDGSSLGILKHYLTTPLKTEPFTLINPFVVKGLDSEWRNKEMSCVILEPGMLLFKKYFKIQGQADIVNLCQKWGVGPGGFYVPRNKYGDKLRLHMTCFGRNWDPTTRYDNPYRSDGSEPPNIPFELVKQTRTIIRDAQVHLDELPSMDPDICLVNFYDFCGRVGLHQDCDESSDSIRRGLPVVLISIGDTAEFWYGHTTDENQLRKVLLESGDVLVYGGKSRLIFHGIKKICHPTKPWALSDAVSLQIGHLNLTLKQF